MLASCGERVDGESQKCSGADCSKTAPSPSSPPALPPHHSARKSRKRDDPVRRPLSDLNISVHEAFLVSVVYNYVPLEWGIPPTKISMRINWTRVILGGLLAGLIVNVCEYIVNSLQPDLGAYPDPGRNAGAEKRASSSMPHMRPFEGTLHKPNS